MNASTLYKWLEAARESHPDRNVRQWAENVEWFEGYANGLTPEHGILSGNWNSLSEYDHATKTRVTLSDIPERFERLASRLGIELVGSGMASCCDGCYKCIEKEPDCWSWRPEFIVRDEAITCAKCIAEDPEPFLEAAEGEYWPLESIDPSEHGYVYVNELDTTIYIGSPDSWTSIASKLKAAGVHRFVITNPRQFEWGVYVHESEVPTILRTAKRASTTKIEKPVPVSRLDYRDARDGYAGWCVLCEDWTRDSETEPDAVDYQCPECKEFTCVGAEHAVVVEAITVQEDCE